MLALCQLPGVPDAHLTVAESALFVGGEASHKLALGVGEPFVSGTRRRLDDSQTGDVLEHVPPNMAETPKDTRPPGLPGVAAR